MPIEEAIVALLTEDPTLSGLVAKRVYPGVTPEEGLLPAVSYFRVSSARDYTMDDTPGSGTTVAFPRFQFDCKSNSFQEARQVAAALDDVLSGYAGTAAGVEIKGCFARDERDVYDRDTKIWMVQKDFEVIHLE